MSNGHVAQLTERGLLAIRGEEAGPFLQGLISNDINKVSSERAIYASLLTAQGKFLHDFFVVALAAAGRPALVLDLERGRIADLMRRLMLYRMRTKVEFEDVTAQLRVHAAWGPGVAAKFGLEGAAPGMARPIAGGVVAVDPRHAGLGVRLWLAADGAEATSGLTSVAGAAYDAHRLALGIPDGSRDVAIDKNLPLECGFDELNAIDYQKGCYVGQEMTARTHYRATIRKRLYQVAVEGELPAPGTLIMRGETEAGEMRSGVGKLGLALLRIEEVEAAGRGTEALTAGTCRLHPSKPAWANF
jgi:folate-binding protein YgfZ